MSGESEEQNKTEDATPFKLRKAREKGSVARGTDLGFAGSLIALAIGATFAGQQFVLGLAEIMRLSFTSGAGVHAAGGNVLVLIASIYWHVFQPLIVFGVIIAIALITLELLQLRGLIFTTHPLKPDFKRLNPAKGIKRLFSMRMLKEALKNIVKFAAYCLVTGFVGYAALENWGAKLTDANWLVLAMEQSGMRLVFAFIALALVFAVIDQIIVRGEFSKQMRMSKREVTREHKEREGEPRLKQKRKDLHQQMRKQSEQLGKVPGADLVVVNPEHFAVALSYDQNRHRAPVVRAKGRNHSALLMKRKAYLNAVPVIADPPLARRLFAECPADSEIRSEHFHDVAKHYRHLRARASSQAQIVESSG